MASDQSRALNALAPFLALAKSATSPRAAADLITQATSAPNTYVFAELLQQPNIRSLAADEQYGSHYALLETFAWGTWESYKAAGNLPALSEAQAQKLRLLSLLSIAAEKGKADNLSYTSLCARLELSSPADLESLVTTAIYNNLLTGTLNPSTQTVVITSTSPLRDLAPGSLHTLLSDLTSWSSRCASVLADLQAEIQAVEARAAKRAKVEQMRERQVRAATEDGTPGGGKGGRSTRSAAKKESSGVGEEEDDDEDAMDVDGGLGAGGKKRSGGGGAFAGMIGKFGGKGGVLR